MKLTISGSNLEHNFGPLHATVRQSEGVDYDKTAIAIYNIEGKPNLCGMTHQPSCDIYALIELGGASAESGASGIDGSAGSAGVANQQSVSSQSAIATSIEPCGDEEYWLVKNSSFTQRNRAAGTSPVDYELTGEQLDIRVGEKSLLHLAAKHCSGAIDIPSYDEYLNPVTGTKPTASGIFQKCVLAQSLKSAASVCRLSAKTSSTNEGSVHLQIIEKTLRVEALSNKVQSVYSNPKANNDVSDFPYAPKYHLSISTDAASALADITRISGMEAYWIYYREEKRLYVWCLPYVMVINVEEMNAENCVDVERQEVEIDVTRTELLTALRRVKAAGNTAVTFLMHTSGAVEVTAENGAVEETLAGKSTGVPFVSPYLFRMPVAAMLTVVKDADIKDVALTCRLTGPEYMVLVTGQYSRVRIDTI